MEENIVIDCRDASFGYGGRAVIGHITFRLERGAYLCVVGENGAGKTTLLKALVRLIPPLAGSVESAPGMGTCGTGYVPQARAAPGDFPASAEEVALSGFAARMGLRPFYTKAEKAEAEANLRRMRADGLKRRCFRELSGGQQRRVLIARALCASRTLLALDEPASGLDPQAAAELYELLSELNRERGVTIIMVTHDIPAALRYGTHILHLAGGPYYFGDAATYPHSDFGKMFLRTGGTDHD